MANEMLDAIILGGFGGTVYLYMSYCIYRILQHLKNNQETALTKLLIDEDARNAFKILAISTTAVATLFTARIITQSLNMEIRPSPFIMAMPLPLLGIAYFFHQIKEVTQKNN